MKSYIKTLASLLVVLTFTACNDFEDFDSGTTPVHMPEITPGYYTANYNADNKYEYMATVTEDAQGNKVVYTQRVGKPATADSGLVRTTGIFTNPEYNEKIGALTGIMDKVEETFYEDTTHVVLAYSYDGSTLYYEVSAGNSRDNATLTRAEGYPPVNGKWYGKSADGTVEVSLFFEDDNETVLVDDESLTYTTAGATTTLSDGRTVAYNEKYQLVYTDGETSFVLDRKCNDPEPEVFEPLYEGSYIHAAKLIDADGALFENGFDATLFQSQKDPNRYILAPFYNNGDGLLIEADDEGTLHFNGYTGIDDTRYGPVYFTDIATTGYQSNFPDYVSHYDASAGVMYLDGAYNVSAGIFGFYEDIFVITAEATNKKHFIRKQGNTQVAKKAFNLNPAISIMMKK